MTDKQPQQQVRVSYDSEVLGSGVFWVGAPAEISKIRNIPARRLAERVVKDGVARKDGMWQVEMDAAMPVVDKIDARFETRNGGAWVPLQMWDELKAAIAARDAEIERLNRIRSDLTVQLANATTPAPGGEWAPVGGPLLRRPVKSLAEVSASIPGGCYCPPDRCGAPVIMGRQTPCLRRTDPAPEAAQPADTEAQVQEVLAHIERIEILTRKKYLTGSTDGWPAIDVKLREARRAVKSAIRRLVGGK
jgi:hypothetical protein